MSEEAFKVYKLCYNLSDFEEKWVIGETDKMFILIDKRRIYKKNSYEEWFKDKAQCINQKIIDLNKEIEPKRKFLQQNEDSFNKEIKRLDKLKKQLNNE